MGLCASDSTFLALKYSRDLKNSSVYIVAGNVILIKIGYFIFNEPYDGVTSRCCLGYGRPAGFSRRIDPAESNVRASPRRLRDLNKRYNTIRDTCKCAKQNLRMRFLSLPSFYADMKSRSGMRLPQGNSHPGRFDVFYRRRKFHPLFVLHFRFLRMRS